ncbi:unnamed protein product [Prunus armeniaca]
MDALSSMLIPPLYTIGPIQLLLNQIPEDSLSPIGYSLWKEETECLQWLNSKAPNSVVYVNFDSIAVMTPQHLVEFGWGLANSKFHFFWVIRSDLVIGESAYLPPEFVAETKERGLIASWCPQEEVLNHLSVVLNFKCEPLDHSPSGQLRCNLRIEEWMLDLDDVIWEYPVPDCYECTVGA